MRYDIVMVTYNSMKWLRACVAALAAVQYPLEELHLVFADNGSTDGTLEELRRMAGEYPAFGGFTVAENGANLGFGAACNRGAAKGSAPLLIFLNWTPKSGPTYSSAWTRPPCARRRKRRRLSAVSFPMKQGITSIP